MLKFQTNLKRKGQSGFPGWPAWFCFTACLLFCLQILPGLAKDEPNFDEILKDGTKLLAIGESEKALSFFEHKLKKYPLSGACHTAMGRALKRLGRLDQAKEAFRKSIEVDPYYADGFYEIGVLLESDKDWAHAAQAFERYVELKPDSAQRKTVEDRIQYCKGQSAS